MNRVWGLALLMFLSGCKKNPTNRLSSPVNSGAVSQSSNIYTVYDDELKTSGGLGFFPGGENQSIELDSKTSANGVNAIQYAWNGQDVINNDVTPPVPEHLFAGFQLLITETYAGIETAAAKNLSGFGYSSMTFLLKGTLSSQMTIRVEGPSDGIQEFSSDSMDITSADLAGGWKRYVMPLSPASLTTVRAFFKLSFQYDQAPRTSAPGNGGVVYLDDIRYEK